ncbi:MAG TPA: DUF1232 domain-containing protein [Dictyoglomaceae bacterium]|nr:DUF1232 domain-containing protein [Dictyoglomaceae bacterium]HOL39395.1 DUF1232 domain-containing protein [Dictyoglomaceae bacterium]
MSTFLSKKVKELRDYLSALYLAYKRKDTPIIAKIFVGLTVGYALSPIDIIPDFIPILGYLDDLIILPLLIYLSIKLIPKNILEECRKEAKGLYLGDIPEAKIASILIVLIWVLIILLIIYRIFIK